MLNFGRRKRELAETRALLEQSKALIVQQKSQLEQIAQSYALVKYESDRYDYEEIGGKQRRVDRELVSEWVEAEMMGGSGVGMERLSGKQREAQAITIKERMWEIELALEDRGWQRQLALAQTEFSRYGLQQIILMSRLYFIKNPIFRRAVLLASDYTIARGVEISCDDPDTNDFIREFLSDPNNQRELGHIGLTQKDQTLQTDGNLFVVFFRNEGTGALQVRTIDATEIVDIVTDPDDATVPWYYHRRWMARTFDITTGQTGVRQEECWYPALGFDTPVKRIGNHDVMVKQPVYHVKGSGSIAKWLFALPELYAMIDGCRAYKNFLEDWASVNRALARFATTVETKGGVQAIQNFQKVLGTTLGVGGTSVETNPTPVTGSAFITGPGNKLEAFKTSGSQGNPEQGRRLGLLSCSASGFPETMLFGDASTGSLATATSLDRPTELKILQRQEIHRNWIQTVVGYAVENSATAPNGKLREAWKAAGRDPAKILILRPLKKLIGNTMVEVWTHNGQVVEADAKQPNQIRITVKFPAVLEHDIAVHVSAIVQAATLGGFQLGGTMDMKTVMLMLMAELGVEDPDAVFDAMYTKNDTGGYDPTNYADNGKADPPADATPDGQPPPQPGAHLVTPSFGREALREAHLARAIDMLVAASKKMQGRNN